LAAEGKRRERDEKREERRRRRLHRHRANQDAMSTAPPGCLDPRAQLLSGELGAGATDVLAGLGLLEEPDRRPRHPRIVTPWT
jgi:hypothetical protein